MKLQRRTNKKDTGIKKTWDIKSAQNNRYLCKRFYTEDVQWIVVQIILQGVLKAVHLILILSSDHKKEERKNKYLQPTVKHCFSSCVENIVEMTCCCCCVGLLLSFFL